MVWLPQHNLTESWNLILSLIVIRICTNVPNVQHGWKEIIEKMDTLINFYISTKQRTIRNSYNILNAKLNECKCIASWNRNESTLVSGQDDTMLMKQSYVQKYLPANPLVTCISLVSVTVWNVMSADTSHVYRPDVEMDTFLRTTVPLFEPISCFHFQLHGSIRCPCDPYRWDDNRILFKFIG